jgi:hypothetical protein
MGPPVLHLCLLMVMSLDCGAHLLLQINKPCTPLHRYLINQTATLNNAPYFQLPIARLSGQTVFDHHLRSTPLHRKPQLNRLFATLKAIQCVCD